jgi:fatty-acyl-CoA synthase
MNPALNAFPTLGSQTLRALARYPDRVSFAWPGGSIT